MQKEQTLYSIIRTVDVLEHAYMNGKVTGENYDSEWRALFHQYQVCSGAMMGFEGLDRFIKRMQLDHCVTAQNSIKQQKSNWRGEDTNRKVNQCVFQITSSLISCNDILEMNMRGVDEVAPSVREVHQSIANYPNLPREYKGLGLMQKWVTVLDQKKATDSLSDDEIRELKYDLTQSLQSFNSVVLGS